MGCILYLTPSVLSGVGSGYKLECNERWQVLEDQQPPVGEHLRGIQSGASVTGRLTQVREQGLFPWEKETQLNFQSVMSLALL